MDEFYKRKPFYNRHEFSGTLSKGSAEFPNLQIVIQYTKLRADKILGKIYGNIDNANELRKMLTIGGPYWKLRSGTYDENMIIRSDKVLVKEIMRTSWPDDIYQHMIYQVADLELIDLEIVEVLTDSSEEDRREVRFFLSGPRELWHVYENRERSYTGEIIGTVKNPQFEVDEDLPFDIEISPYYFFENQNTEFLDDSSITINDIPESQQYEITTNVLTIALKTKKSIDELSNEDFLDLGRQAVDDLTLLVSLISKHWVTWYIYDFYDGRTVRHYVRLTREGSTAEITPENCLVQWSKTRDFIKTAFSKYRQLPNLINSSALKNGLFLHFVVILSRVIPMLGV